MAAILARLERLDRASSIGAWTRSTLDVIDLNPEVRAPDLAAQVGRETGEFKRDVRKLKELGLTESLDIGRAVVHLARLAARCRPSALRRRGRCARRGSPRWRA